MQPDLAIGIPGDPDYLQLGRWWDLPVGQSTGLARGWVRDERFGCGQVIKGKRPKAYTRVVEVDERSRLAKGDE
jgi:hypothetical protein